jgi:hypothetical protein
MPTSTAGSVGSALAALQPCDLVSASALSQLQLAKTDSGTASGARSCGWQRGVDENGLNGYAAGVDIRDSGDTVINTVVAFALKLNPGTLEETLCWASTDGGASDAPAA